MESQEEFVKLTQPLGAALINYVPEHFKTAFCSVEGDPQHAHGRLRYRIGSDEHPTDGTDRPSPELHDAAYAIARYFAQQGQRFPGFTVRVTETDDAGWKFSLQMTTDSAPLATEDEESTLWQNVYEARERAYVEKIGALPEYIQKMMNLTGVWPGGGLFQIENSKIGGACVTTSFGLSNADMPTSARSSNAAQSRDGNTFTFTGSLSGRTPRWVASDLAGYGYEIVVLTKKPEPWANNLVAWAVNAELLNDVEMLERVQEIGAVTVQELSLGNGRSADVLIAPATSPLPPSLDLPNGKMNLLVITVITRPEMEFALKEGQHTLVKRLAEAGVGQISDLDRKSIV